VDDSEEDEQDQSGDEDIDEENGYNREFEDEGKQIDLTAVIFSWASNDKIYYPPQKVTIIFMKISKTILWTLLMKMMRKGTKTMLMLIFQKKSYLREQSAIRLYLMREFTRINIQNHLFTSIQTRDRFRYIRT
jgi:hypothetical protein